MLLNISSGVLNLSAPPVCPDGGSDRRARVIAEIVVVSIGGALLVGALAANQRWLDTHFLPSWFLPRHWYVLIEACVRLVMAALGASLALFARPRVGRLVAQTPALALHAVIAAVLALGASGPVLPRPHSRPTEWAVRAQT